MLYKMQNSKTTAGKTATQGATITLVAVIDCHSSHNLTIENVHPAEKEGIKSLLARRGYQVAERRHKPEPTCDNCAFMSMERTDSGNHSYAKAVELFENRLTEIAHRHRGIHRRPAENKLREERRTA